MAIVADSNILLRAQNPADVHHPVALRALSELRVKGEEICITAQNIVEFWAVATRSVNENGLGLPVAAAASEVDRLLRFFRVLPSNAATLAEWRRLVATSLVAGKQTHDAHLVACMLSHQVTRILTFNVKDFARYPGVEVIDPAKV